jgi:heptosyltransferase-2
VTPITIEDPSRILIVLPTWVGDFAMATPALRAIRDRFPQSQITFLAVENLRDMIDGGDWMDEVVTWPAGAKQGRVGAFLKLIRELYRRAFGLAVLFPNSFRSGLVAALSGVSRRVGYDRDGRGFLLTDRLDVPRENGDVRPHPICDYYARIAMALGCPDPGDRLELFTTPASDAAIAQRLDSLGIAGRHPKVVISPGASFGASKMWLSDRFAAVADRLRDAYAAAVVITCGPGEEGIAREIADAMTRPVHVFDQPRLSLGELKSLIERSDLLICTDAGPRHIAKAFDVPVVTIFGPTHQAWTDTSYENERKVSIPVDCGPCQQKVCPLGHHKCMTGVTVEMVYERCAELLARQLQSLTCQ